MARRPRGHTSLGTYRAWFEHDWTGSEREFQRAIALNPNYAFAHDQLGLILGFLGRYDEAIRESRYAMALDPLSPSILIDAFAARMIQGNVAAATELSRKAAELDPTFYFPTTIEAMLMFQQRKFREAIPLLERSRRMDAPSFTTAYLAYAYGMTGDRARAMATLDTLNKASRSGHAAPFDQALVYLGLGDHVRALDNFERAYAADAQSLVWLKLDKIYDPLRSQPRFVALLRRLNFAK